MKQHTTYIIKTLTILTAILISVSSMGIIYGISLADSRYKNIQPIPSVVENNASKMSKARNLKSISPNEAIYYVCDPITDEATAKDTLAEIKTLSNSLVSGAGSEYAKIKALADYVGDTVAYDLDAAHNYVGFDEICIRNVLDRKRSTCAGFANLFSSLCNAQGIYCVNIRGASPGDGVTWADLGNSNVPRNHEWNAVWYNAESRWIYVDCTWNSTNRFQNGTFKSGARVDTFFDLDAERFAIEHKAIIVDYRNFQSAANVFTTPTTTTPKTTPKTTPTTKPVTKKPALSTSPIPPNGNTNADPTNPPATKIVTSISYIDDDRNQTAIVSEVVTVTDVFTSGEVDSDTDKSESDELSSDGEDRFYGNDVNSDGEDTEDDGGLSGFQKGVIVAVVVLALGGGTAFAIIRKKGL
jgi:hypothetical protein